MLNYMNEGGAIMWIIAALSAIALAVAVERLIFFKKASGNAKRLKQAFSLAARKEAELSGDASSLSQVFADALLAWQSTGEDLKRILEESVRREIYRWERNLFILELVGKLAPMLGLLGTVLGMVEMFGSLHAGGQISAEAVTGGIWKALYTTVAGLSVAIPDIFVCGLLNSRIDAEEEKLRRGAEFALRLHMESRS